MSLQSTTIEVTRRVGLRVKAARMRAGLSQERLGDALGVTFQQVQKYEKGTNRIAVATLHKIAVEVGVPASSLLDPDGPETALPPSFVTAENFRLLQAFTRIADANVRTKLIGLAEAMAELSGQAGAA